MDREVATKSRPVARRRGARRTVIPRDRLVSPLVNEDEPCVVLIDAPAGFGKSTVLAEWRTLDTRPFALLRLGYQHDDPVLLTAAIASSIGELAPMGDEVYTALHGAKPGTLKVAVPRLLQSLSGNESPIVLALDDVHALSDPASLAVIQAVAEGLPAGSRLALASRGAPAIHLGRLRANGDLLELRAGDLAMNRNEAAAMLNACGLRLDTASIDALLARTEGWPAALYLASMSLGSDADPNERARQFAGDDRLVGDYLRDEFLASLDTGTATFLSRTSILDELSGELCDAVLAVEGSGSTLRTLARSNALVTPLDPSDHKFRYHALLREVLESELHRQDPRDEADLHARAAEWYATRDDFDRAVPHAIATGNVESAAALIWSQTASYASAGRQTTLERWLESFTRPESESSAPLSLVHATCALTAGNGAEVEHWTACALAAVSGIETAEAETIRVAADVIEAGGSARDGVISMRASAMRAFELLPAQNPWRALCRLLEGVSHQLTNEPEPARTALEDGARRAAVAVPSIHAIALGQLALMAVDDGDDAGAGRLSAEATAVSRRHGLVDTPTQVIVPAVAALVGAINGDAAAASRYVREARALLAELVEMSPWYQAEVRVVIARALTRLEDVAGARAQLADVARDLRQVPDAPRLGEWVQQAWTEADAASMSGRWPLSPAELRLLRYLPTHLSFREIAEELFVSPNTVKTQARSVYQKLGVSSRAEAVACARTAGLLESAPGQ